MATCTHGQLLVNGYVSLSTSSQLAHALTAIVVQTV